MTDKYTWERVKLKGSNDFDIEALAKKRIKMTDKQSNNDKLRALMKANNLTYQATADISGYSYHTIASYMLPSTSKASRNVNDRALERISHKIDTIGRVLGKEA